MVMKHSSTIFTSLAVLLVMSLMMQGVQCGFYNMMANAMGWNSGWESKGVTFGIKSKGMTAIIPIPLPIPIFSKDKKKEEDSGSNGSSNGGSNGGGGGNMKGGSSSGGWEMPAGGSDWWK